jgi:hypothetical protein
LKGLHEGFGHAVALGAFHWREAGLEVQGCSDLEGAIGREDRTVVRQPLDPVGRPEVAKPLLNTLHIISLTISPEIPAVVATQLMTSRSWLSSANAIRTPAGELEHVRIPAHQRMLERLVMTVPSCARGTRRPVFRASSKPYFIISRGGPPARGCI